jgi:hypothetical protein
MFQLVQSQFTIIQNHQFQELKHELRHHGQVHNMINEDENANNMELLFELKGE